MSRNRPRTFKNSSKTKFEKGKSDFQVIHDLKTEIAEFKRETADLMRETADLRRDYADVKRDVSGLLQFQELNRRRENDRGFLKLRRKSHQFVRSLKDTIYFSLLEDFVEKVLLPRAQQFVASTTGDVSVLLGEEVVEKLAEDVLKLPREKKAIQATSFNFYVNLNKYLPDDLLNQRAPQNALVLPNYVAQPQPLQSNQPYQPPAQSNQSVQPNNQQQSYQFSQPTNNAGQNYGVMGSNQYSAKPALQIFYELEERDINKFNELIRNILPAGAIKISENTRINPPCVIFTFIIFNERVDMQKWDPICKERMAISDSRHYIIQMHNNMLKNMHLTLSLAATEIVKAQFEVKYDNTGMNRPPTTEYVSTAGDGIQRLKVIAQTLKY